jgi:DNA mismatch endonuclease (patch repair protein)
MVVHITALNWYFAAAAKGSMTPQERSALMSRIRSKDTKPEMTVRKLVFSMGYRYRLHKRDLPGKPDLVFSGKKKVIFVHGCFWHAHSCKRGFSPKTNAEFWAKKLGANRLRDAYNVYRLHEMGWKALTVWECEIDEMERLERIIREFLGS